MTVFEHIELRRQGAIGLLCLNRPGKLNALTPTMRTDLLAAFREAESDPAIRSVVVTGAGRAFCAGGDIRHLKELKDREDEAGFVRLLDEGMALVRAFRASDKPVFAAVDGDAYGAGLSLALGCDFRWCTPGSRFAFPFIKLGLGPDWGGTYLLPRIVGTSLAAEMLYSGEGVDSETAERCGLVTRIVDRDELIPEMLRFCEAIATRDPDVIAHDKHALHAAQSGSFEDVAALERRNQLANFRSETFRHGITAFLTRRDR